MGCIEKPTGLGPNAASNYKTHEWARGISRPCKFIDLFLSEAGAESLAPQPRHVLSWRATADEDGHYSFAVAL